MLFLYEYNKKRFFCSYAVWSNFTVSKQSPSGLLRLISFLVTLSINFLSVNDFTASRGSRKKVSLSFHYIFWRMNHSFVTRGKLRAISSASVFLFSLHEESFVQYLLHLCFFFRYTRKASRNIFCICVSFFVTRGKLRAISSASVFLFVLID